MTRCRILHQRTVKIICALLCFPKSLKHVSKSNVVTAFECLIVNLLKQWSLVREDGQSFAILSRFDFHNSQPQHGLTSYLTIYRYLGYRFLEKISGFIDFASAPV